MTQTQNAFARAMKIEASGSSALLVPRTRAVNWLAQHFPNEADRQEYAREKVVEAIASAVDTMMERAGMTQADVATKLNRSRGFVSRALSGAHNMTLHTLGDLLWATNTEVRWDPDELHLAMEPLGIVEVSIDDLSDWTSLTTPLGAIPVAGQPLSTVN